MIHKEFNEVPKDFKRLEGATTAPRDKVYSAVKGFRLSKS